MPGSCWSGRPAADRPSGRRGWLSTGRAPTATRRCTCWCPLDAGRLDRAPALAEHGVGDDALVPEGAARQHLVLVEVEVGEGPLRVPEQRGGHPAAVLVPVAGARLEGDVRGG